MNRDFKWFQLDGATHETGATQQQFTTTVTRCRRAIFRAAEGASAVISIGPNESADWATVAPGEEYLIEAPSGFHFDLSEWYTRCEDTAQDYRVLYI